jgi:hypothetical protein
MSREKAKSRIAEEIDANLKRAFDDVSNEALPDRFSALLNQLRASESGGRNDDSGRNA